MVSSLLANLDLLQRSSSWQPSRRPTNGERVYLAKGRQCTSLSQKLHLPITAAHGNQSLPQADVPNRLPGSQDKGRKLLSHPDYKLIQDMWHPTLNQGKQPAEFSHASGRKVWLRCPGCIYGCGRQHVWEAKPHNLIRQPEIGTKCPYCASKRATFCPCRSVAADARLSQEWHPDNHPASQATRNSNTKYLWVCPVGHPPYEASCKSRCHSNSGCPVCALKKTSHPVLSEGRPDLAAEWDYTRNTKSPSEVTLGSAQKAWWKCSRNAEHPRWQALVFNRALKGTGCPACRAKTKLEPRKFGVQ